MNTAPEEFSANTYVSSLKLDFDPFEAKATAKDFFAGAGRQHLINELMALARTSGSILAVTGELGIGKTTLAHALRKQAGKELQCALVQATLFMSRTQFYELLSDELGLTGSGGASASASENGSVNGRGGEQAALEAISTKINDLALNARALVLVIDDAQELASDVHDAIATLLRKNSGGGFSVILLGEPQLEGLLERGLPGALCQQVQYHEFPLFSREDSESYARHKLSLAGYRKSLPLSGGELGGAHNASAGHPGKLNVQLINALNISTRPTPRGDSGEEVRSIGELGKSYWLLAGSLVLLLLAVVLWPVADPRVSAPESVVDGSQSIPVALGQRSAQTAAPALPVANQPIANQSGMSERNGNAAIEMEPNESEVEVADAAVVAATQSSANADGVPNPGGEESAEEVASASAEGVQTSGTVESPFSSFEQSLFDSPASNFTVQILGSRSEQSIMRFLEQNASLNGGGYFETRFEGEPWFVIVAGNYSERQFAEQAIARMPAEVRELQPWVRSLRDVQSSLRDRLP